MTDQIITRRLVKYRIYPTKRQKTVLDTHLALCCELYNAALQERRDAWKLNGVSVGFNAQCAQLPQIKVERAELKDVYARVLQNVLRRVDKTFNAFFRRCKLRKRLIAMGVKDIPKPGYPRFKSRRRYNSLTYPQYPHRGFGVFDGYLNVSRIGNIKIRLHREIEGKIKTLTLKRSPTDKWFAYFSIEIEPKPSALRSGAVGVDVGLTHFATLSTGERIPNPRFFRREEATIAKAQRKLDAEKRRTPQYRLQRKVVARINERVKWRRCNFAHQLSRSLVNRFGAIFFEDLDIRGMVKNHRLAKSISDAAWNQLFQFTSYKAENAGGLCKQIDPRNTSKLTFCCGELVEMTLADRTITCPKCHSTTDRDWNASLNIRARGLASLGVTAIEAPAV